ncbi:hypothetical protein JXA70_08845 [candidate division KSB1 bacterium]|nr:hypothetical protein [candidate division KSB1 bacterium]
MHQLLQKLQYKDFAKIYIYHAPADFKGVLEEIAAFTTIKKNPNCKQQYEFALFFVSSCEDIQKLADKAAAKIPGDGILWFAYPKKSSKKYKTDISRDHGWQPLGDLGFEAVRQVAIDDDWSALRFRRVQYIKTLARRHTLAISPKGKQRIQ